MKNVENQPRSCYKMRIFCCCKIASTELVQILVKPTQKINKKYVTIQEKLSNKYIWTLTAVIESKNLIKHEIRKASVYGSISL